MALSKDTFGLAGGAVSDLFAGFAAPLKYGMQATGLRLQAQGLQTKAAGDIAEGRQYGLAAGLARQNEQYIVESTAIQQKQLDRSITLAIGGQTAATAGAGLKTSGSALDLLADSAAQGALAKDVLAKQGLIQEAGYEEQAKSYDIMQSAANYAAGQEMDIAAKTGALAQQTQDLGKMEQTADFASAAFKGAAAVASLFI